LRIAPFRMGHHPSLETEGSTSEMASENEEAKVKI
jgi:hypothetical protein